MKSNIERVMVHGRKPSVKNLELQKAGIKLFAGSLESFDNAAKNLVALAALLLTAYMGIFTFFKINEKMNSPYILGLLIIILFIWLLSVVFSVLAFTPFRGEIDLNCVTEIENSLYNISNRKRKFLLIGFILFIVFILLSISLLWFGA
jgi:hypothetical protein